MDTRLLAREIGEILQTWFHFPEKKVYCQVATVREGKPKVRTMDFYRLTEDGRIILMTETSTNKWGDLGRSNEVALCLGHLDFGQIICEGKVELITAENNSETASFYWENYLDDYWRRFYLGRPSKDKEMRPPLSFGVICIEPVFWEVLETNQKDFLKSRRRQFMKNNNTWMVEFAELS